MKIVLVIIGLAGLASVANATVTTTYFASSTENLNATSASYGLAGGNVTVYDAQVNTHFGGSDGNVTYPPTSNNTESGLFTLYDAGRGGDLSGIAPYASDEGSSHDFGNQGGIADYRGYDNILVLQLTGFTSDTSLSLLLEAGMSGDKVNIYTGTGALPTTLNGLTPVDSGISVPQGGTTTIGPLAGLSASGNGWIAIQADCTNLVLNGIRASTPIVPEPRYYGMLLAGMLSLAGIVYKRRSNVQADAQACDRCASTS